MSWYYENSNDNSLRFVLGYQKEDFLVKKSIICIGVNPSTATPDEPDPTIKNVIKLAKNNDYHNFYMMNLYPQRATDIKLIDEQVQMDKHEQNINWFRYIIESYSDKHGSGIDIWCAWGNLIKVRGYLRDTCLKDIGNLISNYGCRTYSIGRVSKEGNPHHPLYIKSNTLKEDYSIDHYL